VFVFLLIIIFYLLLVLKECELMKTNFSCHMTRLTIFSYFFQFFSFEGQEKFDGKLRDLRHTYNICTLGLNANLPEEPIPGFREHIAELAKDFKSLSSLILQALAVGLELHQQFFTEKHMHMVGLFHQMS
jgi:hypothetical protein